MADIARLAGVSVSTVSRALSDHPRIGAETRSRIHELARSLNYAIDARGQMMRGKSLQTVAVAFPYFPERRHHFEDPFFLALIGSLGDALIDSGHSLLIVPVPADQFERITQPWETRQAIGTILLGQEGYHDRINALAVRGTPLVVWGARMPDQLYCTVGSDNVGGARSATAHLLATGARRIAFLGDVTLAELGQRHLGYLAAHRERGIEPDPRLLCAVPFEDAGVRRAVDDLLDAGVAFDALFACSDLIAIAAMRALVARGLRVPHDVQVTGFDDVALAAVVQPALTTVRQAVERAGRLLVERLLAKLRGETVEPVQMPTELVVRESTRPLPD